MTLVVAVTGPESIWMLADRRLSYAGHPPKEDGRKFMHMDTTDGVAILGYAGLGATGHRTEPADWMSAVLRGRNLTLEQSLSVMAKAMREQFPRHLIQMPVSSVAAHHVIIPAFVENEPRFYTIDIVFASDRKRYQFRYRRHVAKKTPTSVPTTPRLGIGGSGALYLAKNKKWTRSLLRLVKANDRGNISPITVADHLAALNNEVHLALSDKSVGPRCIVAWRFRKGGGGQQFYTGTQRDSISSSLPTISRGMDISALLAVVGPQMKGMIDAMLADEVPQELDKDEINASLACLPSEPDEKLS